MRIKEILKKIREGENGWGDLTDEEKEYYKKRSKIRNEKRSKHYKDEAIVSRNYVDEVEYSKSNRARCYECSQLIGKGTIRGVSKIPKPSYHFTILNKYCSKCALLRLDVDIESKKKAKKLILSRMKSRKKAYEDEKNLRLKDKLLRALENG